MTEPQHLYPDSLACPTCFRPWPLEATSRQPLTERELDALSAWYHYRSVKLTAKLIGVGEQRAKNLLARARQRSGVQTNAELAGMHLGLIRSVEDLVTSRRAAVIHRGDPERAIDSESGRDLPELAEAGSRMRADPLDDPTPAQHATEEEG